MLEECLQLLIDLRDEFLNEKNQLQLVLDDNLLKISNSERNIRNIEEEEKYDFSVFSPIRNDLKQESIYESDKNEIKKCEEQNIDLYKKINILDEKINRINSTIKKMEEFISNQTEFLSDESADNSHYSQTSTTNNIIEHMEMNIDDIMKNTVDNYNSILSMLEILKNHV